MNSSPDSLTPSKTDSSQKEMSPLFKEFSEKLALFSTPEEKIVHGLHFMRSCISQEGSPHFREFWEARRLVLPLFKENLNLAIRSNLWNEYVELTVEARRLKEILEEQSVFAIEQIDLAIKALEEEVAKIDLLIQAQEGSLFEASYTIQKRAEFYNQLQKELNLLNTLASRLNALRKEIVKTDMRIRFKTKFFKRLSELGDHIFPKRKTLIESVSCEFEKDVDQFIEKHFQQDSVVGAPYYALREEIKALQGMAKVFTLNSGCFTRTRLKLSKCWDQIKEFEKEHRNKNYEKRQASSEKREQIQSKIDMLKERANTLSLQELDREMDPIFSEMKEAILTREDVKYLRDELHTLRKPHLDLQEQKAKELEAVEKERLRQKREKVSALKEQIAQLIRTGEAVELEALEAEFVSLQRVLSELNLSKMEKQQLDRLLRPIKDLIADKKEHSLLNLSEDEKKTLENLKLVLDQKKQRRQEIKSQLEVYRKVLGGSNLDFAKAMHYQDLIEQEKQRLEKANSGIEEIEQKIQDLENH